MARKSSKSPMEVLAALEARKNAVLAQSALESAKGNPMVAKLIEFQGEVSRDINALSRELKGPNSYGARRAAFKARLDAIDKGEALAVARDNGLRAARDYLDTTIQGLADRIVKGETIADADLANALGNLPTIEFPDLQEAFDAANAAWKALAAKEAKNENTASVGA